MRVDPSRVRATRGRRDDGARRDVGATATRERRGGTSRAALDEISSREARAGTPPERVA